MRALLLLISFLFFSTAWARWERIDEADFAMNLDKHLVRIAADGSYKQSGERETEILKESARVAQGLTRIQYSAGNIEFKLHEAFTLNGSEKTAVADKHVEIKPLAGRGQGFDDIKQATIGFPNVSVGSKLYYRYDLTNHKPAIPGLFSDIALLGWNLQKNYELSYESEMPLYWRVHDPEKLLEIKEDSGGKKFRLSFRLKAPFYRRVTEEREFKQDPLAMIWIAVSSAKDWASIPKATPQTYEDVMSSTLPASFEKIRAEASAGKNAVEQINAVTSRLAALLRYVGDWAPVEGAYHPAP